MVKVIASKVGVPVRRLHFKYPVSQFKDRDVKSAAPEIEDCYLHILMLFVKTIGKCCGCRFIDNAFNRKAGNFARLFRCLPLRIAEVCRNSDHSLFNFLTQVVLCCFLHFLKNDG